VHIRRPNAPYKIDEDNPETSKEDPKEEDWEGILRSAADTEIDLTGKPLTKEDFIQMHKAILEQKL